MKLGGTNLTPEYIFGMAISLYDVAIIGGGIAGLTAATLLGKMGFDVIVLEKNKRIGAHNKLQMQGFPAFEISNLPINVPLNYKVNKVYLWSPNRSIIPFKFENLPKGSYGVSVLIDTGRPHVPPGSLNFTAFPGDYAGSIKSNVKLESNQTIEVSIEKGLYVTIPDGYDAPLYASE